MKMLSPIQMLEWIEEGRSLAKQDHAAGALGGLDREYAQADAELRGFEVVGPLAEAQGRPDSAFWRVAMVHTGNGEIEDAARSLSCIAYRLYVDGVKEERALVERRLGVVRRPKAALE